MLFCGEESLMKLKDQLPYIGKVVNNKKIRICKPEYWCFLGSSRPNYEEIKNKRTITELECAEILTGLTGINDLLKHSKLNRDFYTHKNSLTPRFVDHDVIITLPQSDIQPQKHHDGLLQFGAFKFYEEFSKLLHQIWEMIQEGISMGEVEKIDIEEYRLENMPEEDRKIIGDLLFKPTVKIRKNDFLRWADENSYPIPDELEFKENNNITDSKFSHEYIDFYEFVRSLTFKACDESGFYIRVPGEKKRYVSHDDRNLGFQFKQTGASKEWNNFKQILEDNKNDYYILSATNPDTDRGILKEIDAKLKKYITYLYKKHSELEAPEKFKTYERAKDRGNGVYYFVFNIDKGNREPITYKDHEDLKKRFERAIEKLEKDPDDEKIHDLVVDYGNECLRENIIEESELSRRLQTIDEKKKKM